MHHKYLLYLFLLSSLPLNAMHDDQIDASEMNIHEATYFGKKERVQELLDSGVDVNERSKREQIIIDSLRPNVAHQLCYKGASPLFVVLRHENQNMVQFLLEHNASVNVKNYYEWTPLLDTILNARPEYVKVFLACGADIDQKNTLGNTPLHMAVLYCRQPGLLSIVKTLLKYNAPVNIKNRDGKKSLNFLLKIDGIKEFYLQDEKSQKKTKKKKVRRRKYKQRKSIVNKNKN